MGNKDGSLVKMAEFWSNKATAYRVYYVSEKYGKRWDCIHGYVDSFMWYPEEWMYT